ncbi:hypothetical protein PFICI_10874 [Pestalotiopsis fici W106-1]|uniref:Uncharacterized protein n=1 Tax=Pestalotiopsis fici (strain W106-1 / CGMCC3.15140) TaxID=1229662 RepID=W3WT13_PESFW|nr:uncharacterized protein PFICI_10874 [Pestalotiopsis fici W106-1]ETS77000.1 hypothetical protein PFICI_10874 [Pestalotiopsis fici W106-1]
MSQQPQETLDGQPQTRSDGEPAALSGNTVPNVELSTPRRDAQWPDWFDLDDQNYNRQLSHAQAQVQRFKRDCKEAVRRFREVRRRKHLNELWYSIPGKNNL